MDDGFISRKLYRYINFSLLCTYLIFASIRLVLYSIEYAYLNRRDHAYMLTNLACIAYGTLAFSLKKAGILSENASAFLTSELTIILILIYGHIFEPQHCYIFTVGSMSLFYFVQIPNLVDYPWMRYACSIKQHIYLVAFGLYSGQIVMKTYSDMMMPASPLFSIFVAYVYQLDINRMMSWFAQLQETRSQLNSIIRAIPVGLVVRSKKDISLFNVAAERLLSCKGTEGINKRLRSLFYSNGNRAYSFQEKDSGLLDDILHYIDHDTPLEVSFGVTQLEGRSLYWMGNKTMCHGEPECVIIIKDVTDMLQLEQARAESQYKNLMLRSVSHELRTPTNGIQHAVITVMESSDVPEWAKEKLKVAEVCSKQLLMLIDDLLDYSQLIVRRFSLVKQNFALRDVFTLCTNMVSLHASQKQIQLVTNIDPLLPVNAFTDAKRLSQVLLNLLSNAIKFTHSGGKIELKATLDENGYMEVSVIDNGIGIPTDRLSSVFNVFSKVNHSSAMNPQGCGLGLHISNMIVNLLGKQDIKVTSVLGQGSSFSFVVDIYEVGRFTTMNISLDANDLCFEYEDENVHDIEIPLFNSQSKTMPNILVVDDAPFNRMVVKDFLASDGLKCVEAESGQDCIDLVVERAKTESPIKMIIMDFEMPEMDGPTTTRKLLKLLKDEGSAAPKIIAHTAYVSNDDQRLCIESGMVDFIPKPSSKSNFLSTIKLHLD
mmetsp:Transcript_9545/g.18590  ORF Transcript_9545/g.18590 Transcript_9545/m.18590 type:complete len:714 (+) Transcript_9545:622-2763(+)